MKTKPKTKKCKFLTSITVLLLFAIISGCLFFSLTPTAEAATWFNDSWQYRKSIPITNNTADQTRVYIQATISTLDTTRFNVGCTDLRFTDASGKVLPYYIVSGCRTASTVVNIYFDNLIAGLGTVYYYYGNSSAPKAASLTNFTTVASSYSVGTIGAEQQGTAPVAYWSFDEGQGTTASDGTTNKNTGTLTNMSATASSTSGWQTEDRCVSGKCLAFDGTDDYAKVIYPTNNSLDPTSAYSLSIWVKYTAAPSYGFIISKTTTGGAGGGYELFQNGGKIRFSSCDAGGTCTGGYFDIITDAKYNDGIWHHIEATAQTGSTAKIYIDGKLVKESSASITQNNIANAYDIYIGKRGQLTGTGYFSGLIDEPRIYSYARTAAQIKLDYNAGLSGMSGRAASKGSSVSVGQRSANWLTNGLVGYWKMDEAVGTWNGTAGEVKDWSGNGNNGTAAGTTGGAASTTAGKFGNGGSFDGVDDYVSVPNSTSLNITGKGITLAAWIKPNVADAVIEIINKKNDSDANGYRLRDNWGKLSFTFSDGVTTDIVVSSSWTLAAGTMAFVVATYDGVNVSLYKNGVLIKQEAHTQPIAATTQPVYIGRYYNSNAYQFNGIIDEARVYNRALSDREVRDLYNYAPGPVGWWKMDEGKGQTAYDSSGNGNNGTLGAAAAAGSDDPVWATGKNGKGLKFDGVNDYASVTDNANIKFGKSSNFTVSVWAKISTPVANSGIVWKRSTAGYGLYYDGATFSFFISNKPTGQNWIVGGLNTPQLNVWYYLTGIYTSDRIMKLYINGIYQGTATISDIDFVSSDSLRMGWRTEVAEYFNGSLDDVRIYNYARTPEQIMEDMNARGNTNQGGSGTAAVSAAGKTTVGYWKFDEGQGTVAYDSSGNKNNGTLVSSTWSQNGKFGKSLSFDGSSSYVNAGTIGTFGSTRNQGFSISAWVKRTSDAIIPVVGVSDNSGNAANAFTLRVNTKSDNTNMVGSVRVGMNSNDATPKGLSAGTDANNVPLNVWTHILVTIYPPTNTIAIYVNGVSKPVTYVYQETPANFANFTNYLPIGAFNNAGTLSQYFSGSLDEVKIYNYALTPDDVRAEYNAGSALKLGSFSTSASGVASSSAASIYCVPGSTDPCSPPVAEWKFEDGKNSVTATDTSGNGNTGTIYPGTAGANTATSSMRVAGKFGEGLKFDGVDDYVRLANNFPTSYPQTVSFWMKPQLLSGSGQQILIADSYNAKVIIIDNSKNQLMAAKAVGQGAASLSNFKVGRWDFVTVVYNSSTNQQIFVDGADKTIASTDWWSASDDNRLGVRVNSGVFQYPFNGLIDEVRIYNYARTAAQVAWDYNRGKPVGWWKFDEGQGGVAHDSSGNNNNGTIYPGTAGTQTATSTMWSAGASGKRNGSLNFDGSDDYVDAGGATSFNFTNTTPFSASTWVNASSIGSTHRYILSKQTSSGGWKTWAMYYKYDQKFWRAYIYDGTTAKTVNVFDAAPTNKWLHLVMTYDGANTLKFYVNGIYKGQDTQTIGSFSTNGKSLLIGNLDGYAYNFVGQIDDIQIFNYALTAQQVKTVYNEGAVGFR